MKKYPLDTPIKDLPKEDQEFELIEFLIVTLHQGAFDDIRKLVQGDTCLASFMVCCCFIEQMATFAYAKDHGKYPFENFVKNYLPNDYNPKKLREDLRNRLVHNYALGKTYALTQKNPKSHLTLCNNKRIINLENFVDDLEIAFNKFKKDLRLKGKIRDNALRMLNKISIVSRRSQNE